MTQRLGHYRVLDRVGSGATGVVYRARDERLERDVAIKVLSGDTVSDAARTRLRKEARAISRAVHPAIATIHDLASDGTTDFLVMELVPGPTVADRIAKGPIAEREVIDIGRQLAAGLQAAHAAGVIHRDIKPSNLKITADGRLKILDFGIAQLRTIGTETTRTGTMLGGIAGTLPYMAPEQLHGLPADARSDVYSAGAVLYELATGTRAFPERHDLEVIDAVLRRPVVPPRQLRPELSESLNACILKALDKDPSRRQQSAAELERDLGNQGTPIVIGPVRRRSPSRRAAWLAAAAAMVVLLGAGWSTRFLPRSRTPVVEQTAARPNHADVRLAVLPGRNLTNRADVNEWLRLVQSLLSAELTGVRDLGVIDSLSLNERLNQRPRDGRADTGRAGALKELGADLAIDNRIVLTGAGLQLQADLIDPLQSEVRFTASADVSGEADLARAARSTARTIVSYLELQVFKLAGTREMRPWMTLRERNIDAVKAFVQANQYIYRFQLSEVNGLLRRAVALDPAYVAPRLWLLQGLADRGDLTGAEAQLRELKALEPTASPFDQAMIGFAGALLADDAAGQIRYLEIALEYSPGNNILLVNLARARAQSGDCTGALRDLDPPIRMRWDFPPIYPLWGWCGIQTRRFEESRRLLDFAAGRQTVDPYTYALLAGLEGAFGADTAAKRFEAKYEATQMQAGRPVADQFIATTYESLGNWCQEQGDSRRATLLFRMRDRYRSRRKREGADNDGQRKGIRTGEGS
jgi:serine/threonine protein kinase